MIPRKNFLVFLFFLLGIYSNGFSYDQPQRDHRAFKDTMFHYPSILSTSNPNLGVEVCQERYAKTNDPVFKLIEAQCYERLDDFYTSTSICLEYIERDEVIVDYFVLSAFYLQLSNLARRREQFKEAIEWNIKVYELGVKHGDVYVQISGHSSNGLIYAEIGNAEAAKQSYLTGIKLFNEIDLSQTFECQSLHSNIGIIYLEEEKYDSALINFKQANKFFIKYDHYEYASYSAGGIAGVYNELGKMDSVEHYLNIALDHSLALGMPSAIKLVYSNLAEVYKEKERWEEASAAQDSIFYYHQLEQEVVRSEEVERLISHYELENEVMALKLQSIELEKDATKLKADAGNRNIIILFCVALLTVLVGWFYIVRMKKDKDHAHLEKRIALLEMHALRSQMNPHFIFNCLNSIQHLFLAGKEEEANAYLTKFSHLLRMTLEHTKLEDIALEEELDLLKQYCDLENLQFENKFKLNFSIDDTIDPGFLRIPSMLFQPFVENAINHGLKHLKSPGELSITFKKGEKALIGIVDDNGIGRAKSKGLRQYINENKTYKSRGIEITNERAKLYGKLKEMNIKMQINDKVDLQNKSRGTEVRIEIPLK